MEKTSQNLTFFVEKEHLEAYAELIPEAVRGILQLPDAFLIGCCDSRKALLAFAVFCPTHDYENRIAIQYLKSARGYLDREYGAALFAACAQYLKEQNVRFITFRMLGKPKMMKPIYDFLNYIGFLPTVGFGHCTLYQAKNLFATKFYETMMRQKSSLPDIFSIPDRNDLYIRRLKVFAEDDFYYFDPQTYDTDYYLFSEEKGEVIGGIFAERVHEKLVYIRDVYISPLCKNPYMPPALVGALLEKMHDTMPGDALLICPLLLEKQYEAFKDLLGADVENLLAQEYVYDLDKFDTNHIFIKWEEKPDVTSVSMETFRNTEQTYALPKHKSEHEMGYIMECALSDVITSKMLSHLSGRFIHNMLNEGLTKEDYQLIENNSKEFVAHCE